MEKKQNLTRGLIYIGITFLLTYSYCFGILRPIINEENLSGVPSIKAQLMTAAAMFFPAIGVLLTRLITKEGFRDHWLKLSLRHNAKYYLLAWFGPGILTILGSVLYFIIYPDQFDLSFGYMQSVLESSGADIDDIPIPLGLLMLVQGLQGLFLAPILNFVTCFGEEWGWRGYLLPKLSARFSIIPTLLISGIIWGLWHAPLTMMGHNYGLDYPSFPYAGIAMMCLSCITMGIFLSYVTVKTNSCIPAILGHGAINGFAAMGIYFTPNGGNPFIGPAPTGTVGMIPFIILAAVLAVQMSRD